MIPSNEPILSYVRRRLEEFRGQWPRIHRESNVPYDSIAKLARGERPNPELTTTIQPLVDWFATEDAKLEEPKPKRRKAAA